MLIDTYLTMQQIMAQTGLSAAELAAMPLDEYARLSGRQTPAQAAVQALNAQYEASAPQGQEQPPAPVQEPLEPPQGVDVSQLSMREYAALRGQLGMTGREYGRGALDGGSTADWIAAAQSRGIGRTSYGQQNVQDAAKPDATKYLARNEPVTGRASFYRGN